MRLDLSRARTVQTICGSICLHRFRFYRRRAEAPSQRRNAPPGKEPEGMEFIGFGRQRPAALVFALVLSNRAAQSSPGVPAQNNPNVWTGKKTFHYTVEKQLFTVPAGVASITIAADCRKRPQDPLLDDCLSPGLGGTAELLDRVAAVRILPIVVTTGAPVVSG